jgi:hypothetical protein
MSRHQPISTAYFINPSYQSVCLYVYPLIVASQRLGKNVTAGTNTRSSGRIVWRIVFNAIYAVPKESRRLVLCYTLRIHLAQTHVCFLSAGRP